jgi:hypothetical protein
MAKADHTHVRKRYHDSWDCVFFFEFTGLVFRLVVYSQVCLTKRWNSWLLGGVCGSVTKLYDSECRNVRWEMDDPLRAEPCRSITWRNA